MPPKFFLKGRDEAIKRSWPKCLHFYSARNERTQYENSHAFQFLGLSTNCWKNYSVFLLKKECHDLSFSNGNWKLFGETNKKQWTAWGKTKSQKMREKGVTFNFTFQIWFRLKTEAKREDVINCFSFLKEENTNVSWQSSRLVRTFRVVLKKK